MGHSEWKVVAGPNAGAMAAKKDKKSQQKWAFIADVCYPHFGFHSVEVAMFWGCNSTHFQEIKKATVDGMTVDILRQLVADGRANVVVPIDPRVSPWDVPKFFTLSRHQSLELMKAFERSPSGDTKIAYLLRSDGKVAIFPNLNGDELSER